MPGIEGSFDNSDLPEEVRTALLPMREIDDLLDEVEIEAELPPTAHDRSFEDVVTAENDLRAWQIRQAMEIAVSCR